MTTTPHKNNVHLKGAEQMSEMNKPENDASPVDSTPEDGVDVETAGETTAAATTKSTVATKPVGADTMVKVSNTPDRADEAD